MKKLSYKNTQISYSDFGKGTAIVLLHGFLENQKMWQHFVPELSQKYRIITIDLLGHGNTECLGYEHTMEENATIVYQVLRKLRIRKAIFVGHSMGGYVALAFAEMFGKMIKGLVLLNSTAYEDNPEKKKNRSRAIKAVKQDYETFVRLSIANLFSPNNRDRLKLEIEKVKLEALKTPLQGIVASQEGMKIRKNRDDLLRSTLFPKLLILGKKDGVLNFDETAKQIENTNMQLVSFPDGHMSHIENKDQLLQVLLVFFKTA